jgi:rare lipoprotein A
VNRGLGTRRQRRALAGLLLAVLGACACAVVRTPVPAPGGARRVEDRAPGPRRSEEGLASWYGEWHQGQPTASGEIFDMTRLTAAHRTLPLGTRLRVTNLENGQIVQVRVNDRGPYVAGRVLDLSRRAAGALGALERGVVLVKLEIIDEK